MIATRSLLRLAVVSSLAVVQACGGGGGDENPPPVTDTTPPTILGTSIADNQTNVARSSAFVITFSEAIAPASVTAATVLYRRGATPVPYTATVAGATVTLTATGGLAAGAAHTVQIGTGVTDVAGNALAAAATYAFTTVDDEAPTVASTVPVDGAIGVALDSTFAFTFSEPVAPATAIAANFTWVQGATPVPFTVSGVSGAVVTLSPTGALASSSPFTVTVGTGVTDVAGNPLAAAAGFDFTTRDGTAPTVTGIDPADGATGVARNKVVTITFSEPIAGGSVTASTLTWTSASGTVAYAKNVTGSTVTLTPTGSLDNQALQTLTVTTGVTDLSGNPLASQVVYTFTTLDNQPPTVLSTSPVDLAVDVSRTPTLTVTFSEPVAPATAVAANFRLSSDDFVGTVSCGVSASGATVTVTPAVQLANATVYKLRVEAGVTDASGNALASPVTIAFTTADTVPPVVVSTLPANNATRVSRSTTFAITFSEPLLGSSVTPASVTWQQGAAPVTFGTAFAGSTLTLTPSGDLASETLQTITVTTDVTDGAGNHLPAQVTFAFMTIDDVRPTIVSALPADGASGVARGASLVITFSEPIDAANVTPSTVSWTDGGVPVTWSRTLVGKTLTLDPVATLSNFSPQVVTVKTGVTDLAGNGLAADVVLDFTSADDVPPLFTADPVAPVHSTPSVLFDSWVADDQGSGLAMPFQVRVNTVPFDTGGLATFDAFTEAYTFDASNPIDYPEGTVLYAQVLARDAAGNETWSGWSNGVAVDRNPPSKPLPPIDPGDVQAGSSIVFLWEPSADAVSGVRDYTIQVATANTGSGIVTTALVPSGTGYTFTGAVDGTTYYARVLATDWLDQSTIYGDFSDGILRNTSVPATPGAPTDGAVYTTDSNMTFSWGTVAGAASYRVELGTTPGGSEVTGATPISTASLSTSYDVGAGRQGETIYARVAAVSGAALQGGWSEPSDGLTLDLVTSPPSAPGTPQVRGATDDTTVTFTWDPAVDLQSGIQLYELRVTDGTNIYFVSSVDPFVDFDASLLVGSTLTAMVQARNGAGTWGDWSASSSPVTIEINPPFVYWSSPSDGQTRVGRAADLTITFSEPMDPASVAAALSLSWGTGSPAHGLGLFWNAAGTQVTIMPDAADPAGITNVDLLPEEATVTVTLGTGATDLAGNHLTAPFAATFTTAEETAPAVASLSVGGFTSPVPAAEVVGPFTIVVTFDEEMSPTRGGIRIETPDGGYEQRYSDWSANIMSAVAGGGQVTYTTGGCPGIQTGDRVTVQWSNPASFDVARAAVLSTGSDGMGNCTFTVAHSPGVATAIGGQVSYPLHGEASIAWTGPTTLELTLPSRVTLAAGSESTVYVSGANDLAGNWMWSEERLQVTSAGGDRTPPVLLSSIPLDGAVGVTRVNPVILRFDGPLDATSLAGIYAVDADGRGWEMRYSADEMGPVLMFLPSAGPVAGTHVDVHVPGTVRDLAGNLLGAPIDLGFDVALSGDIYEPVLFETLPNDGDPVDDLFRASAIFADADTGMLERLDSTSVGPEDVLVVDFDSGLPLRGFRLRNERGSGALEIESPPRGPGFSTGWGNSGFSSATASGGVATFTTSGPHGLQPGWQTLIQVQVGTGDGCFSTMGAGSLLLEVPTADTFRIATACGDGATASSGSLSWRTPRSFVVTLAVPAVAGGTGILDFEGNAMAVSAFTVAMTPPGSNRVPMAESLRDIRLGVTTSPSGRQLGAYLRVRDADDNPVTVTLTALGGMPLTGTTQLLTNTSWGAEYRYGGDGPPSGVSPPELVETYFPTSGFYPFEITLDDGHGGVTTYVREVWVWAAADVPAAESIDDGGVIRPVDPTAPIVVQNTDRPTLTWNNVDIANADFLGLQYIELTAASVGGSGQGPAVLLLDPSLTSAPLPIVAEPTIYAWFATQMKFSPGEMNPESQGWSLDFANMFESTFVYGPANGTLAGSIYAVGRTAFVTDGAGGFVDAWVAGGTYGVQPSVGAPVFLGQAWLVNGDPAPTTGTELFAADALGRFMITTTDPVMGLPLANKGFIGRAGQLFGIVSQSQSAIGLELGVRRDQLFGFGTSLAGRALAFVQFQSRLDGMGGLETEASVGVAAADPAFLTVTGTRSDGTPLDVGGLLPYTLTDDGLLSLDIGSTVAGLLGGTAGTYMGALAERDTAGNDFFLMVAEKYDGWLGTEDESFVNGTYRFVEYTQGNDGAGGLGDVHASYGTITFNGLGGATYTVFSSFGTMTGTGTYAVDPVAGTVSFTADPGTPNEMSFLFQVAPDADTLLGTSISSATSPQVLILSR